MADENVSGEVGGAESPSSQPAIARATKPIPAAWLAEIEQRILRGEAPADFVNDLARLWGRNKRNVWRYVAKVRARLAERAKAADPDADREMIRALLLRAYRTAEAGSDSKGPDAKGMVAAAKVLGELTGVMAVKRVDHTSGGETIGVTVYVPAEREP